MIFPFSMIAGPVVEASVWRCRRRLPCSLFNVFVAIVQSFEKIPALTALAPTQSDPPFKLTQLVVLALLVVLTFVAAIRFRPEPLPVQ